METLVKKQPCLGVVQNERGEEEEEAGALSSLKVVVVAKVASD